MTMIPEPLRETIVAFEDATRTGDRKAAALHHVRLWRQLTDLVAERDQLRARLAEQEADAARWQWFTEDAHLGPNEAERDCALLCRLIGWGALSPSDREHLDDEGRSYESRIEVNRVVDYLQAAVATTGEPK